MTYAAPEFLEIAVQRLVYPDATELLIDDLAIRAPEPRSFISTGATVLAVSVEVRAPLYSSESDSCVDKVGWMALPLVRASRIDV